MIGWNIYSNYQGSALISPTGWNYFSIEVLGVGLGVFLTRAAEPSLVVPRLRGRDTTAAPPSRDRRYTPTSSLILTPRQACRPS